MWLITFLPDAMVALVIYTIMIVGAGLLVASVLTRWFPVLTAYRTPLQLMGIVVFSFGVYLQGARANEAAWQQRVQELEAKVAQAEAASAQATVQIVEKVVNKTQVVREKGNEIVKYIDRYNDREVLKEIPGPERIRVEEVIKYVERCPVPAELLDAHNRAATMGEKK
jgi:flagellar biosynthesis component FlhA